MGSEWATCLVRHPYHKWSQTRGTEAHLDRGTARECWGGRGQGLAGSQPLCLHSYRVGGALEEDSGRGPGPLRLLCGTDGASRTRLWHPKLEAFPDSWHCPRLAAGLLLLVRRYFPGASRPRASCAKGQLLELLTFTPPQEHCRVQGVWASVCTGAAGRPRLRLRGHSHACPAGLCRSQHGGF